MKLLLFLYLLPCTFAPAPLRKVIDKLKTINHVNRKKFCCGFRLVRRVPEDTNDYKSLYPIKYIDFNDNGGMYMVPCDHCPCRNSNHDVEYAIASLVIDGMITREQLNDCRPASYIDKGGSWESSPDYGKPVPGCR